MGESIVITSGKGGVGKSTTAVNLSAGLALSGSTVCLVDADIGLRNLDVLMGLENRVIYDVIDVIEKNCKIEKALVRDKRCAELYLLPAAQTKDKTSITPNQMRDIVAELKEKFDYVIIDCPAGIEAGFKNAVAGADKAIVVTTPENTSLRDADRIIGLLEKENVGSPKLIINRVRSHLSKDGGLLSTDEVVSVLAIDLLGIVPDDESVIRAGQLGEPIVFKNNHLVAKAYRNIVRRIQGQIVPLLPLKSNLNFFKNLKKLLGI